MPTRSNYRRLLDTSFSNEMNSKENFGAGPPSIRGALKTPNYGNYEILNEMASEDAGIQNAGIRMQRTDNNCTLGGGCSSCPKKYTGELKRFYTGVL